MLQFWSLEHSFPLASELLLVPSGEHISTPETPGAALSSSPRISLGTICKIYLLRHGKGEVMFIAKALECLIFYLLYSLAMTGPQIKDKN